MTAPAGPTPSAPSGRDAVATPAPFVQKPYECTNFISVAQAMGFLAHDILFPGDMAPHQIAEELIASGEVTPAQASRIEEYLDTNVIRCVRCGVAHNLSATAVRRPGYKCVCGGAVRAPGSTATSDGAKTGPGSDTRQLASAARRNPSDETLPSPVKHPAGSERPATGGGSRGSGNPLPDLKSGPVTLGEYTIVREIGRGAMGVVYEAIQSGVKRRVALKVLPANVTTRVDTVDRFQREAAAAGRLDHPNIIKVYGAGQQDGTYYFAMQFVPGKSLLEILDQRPMLVDEAIRIVLQIGRALHYAHGEGVIHRDVKPANIMIQRDGTAMLADFGLARDSGDHSLTRSGDIIGTPTYMSPEAASGEKGVVDGRSDLYSLAATFYRMVTGKAIFTDSDVLAVLTKIANEDPVPPRKIRPLISQAVETVIMRALEKEPLSRFANCGEFCDELERIQTGQRIQTKRPGVLRRFKRFAVRHAVATALIACVVVAAGVISTVQVLRAQREADRDKSDIANYLGMGDRALIHSEWDEAVRLFGRVLELDPENTEAEANLARALALRSTGAVEASADSEAAQRLAMLRIKVVADSRRFAQEPSAAKPGDWRLLWADARAARTAGATAELDNALVSACVALAAAAIADGRPDDARWWIASGAEVAPDDERLEKIRAEIAD